MCRKDVMIISDPKQLKVLSDPTRISILGLLRYHPMTVSEIAQALGKDRSTIYRHIKALEDAGLVEEVEKVGNETVYGRVALLFLVRVGPDKDTEEFRRTYLMREMAKLIEILGKAGIRIKDKERFSKLLEEVFHGIESDSQPLIERISSIDLDEITLIHFLNFLTLIYSPKYTNKVKELKELLDI
ncbi:helix-turn-helix domain-containing protein [Pyrococcus sp. ST04]|uniref:helix-turn-helix domain-containing protein n=1 Tax=Pyrococcus sp. ST04 TaxID=1183377 RepID=UPI0002605A33|nr:helix-turn-helix domain-containing protein [Pyrococcus sp. ST04]AFK21988.1 transcriptional regulator, ArsR family [Pyrococcus sp. ST04]